MCEGEKRKKGNGRKERRSIILKKDDLLLNPVLAIDFDKDSDEESLVIDPNGFSGDNHAPQPGSPAYVGDDENKSLDIPAHLQHLPHVLCVPAFQETIDNSCKKLYVPWKSDLVMDLTLSEIQKRCQIQQM